MKIEEERWETGEKQGGKKMEEETKKTPVKILVCDDDPAFRKLVLTYLRSADMDFVLKEAGQKEEIQKALDKGGIDLVLMDILMPDKSGIEWLDEIVEKRIAPVVMLTGFGSEEIAVQSIHEGAIDYIPKDRLTKDRLLSTIKITLETWKRRRAEDEKRRLMEELEETNQKLERSNRELQDFAYIASHDLREPMRKISAFGQLLQESLKGKLDDDEQENLAFMIDGANRMQQMIDALLTYSRVTTKTKPAKRVDLNEAIEDLKNVELAALLEETEGTIRIQKPLPAVQADPSQVHQLLQNVIANGLKFHRDGIPPEIAVRGRQEKDNQVRVEVEDNGVGIEEANYEKIFGMFQRLYSREGYKGSGIGLAVCKKIVERHGGTIGVNSTLGKGSTFWFTMPGGEKGERRREMGKGREVHENGRK